MYLSTFVPIPYKRVKYKQKLDITKEQGHFGMHSEQVRIQTILLLNLPKHMLTSFRNYTLWCSNLLHSFT